MAMSDYISMPNGLLLPDHLAEDIARASQPPTCVDLFAGCGGFSCGMIQAGFHVVAALEWDPLAAITYMMNLGSYPCQFVFVEDGDRKRLEKTLSKGYKKRGAQRELEIATVAGSGWISELDPRPPGCGVFFLGDVRKVHGRDILAAVGLEVGELDCVVGGPPCQGYSIAGKQNVMDPRNSLVFEFARLVVEMQPKAMVMENVPGIVNMVTPEGLGVIDVFCRILEDGKFAGVDALKRSMGAQDVFGMTRSKPVKKPARAKKPERETVDECGGERCFDCEGEGKYPAGHTCKSCGGSGRVPIGSNG